MRIFFARVTCTNGDFALEPSAVRASVRAQSVRPSAVTTPSSSSPSSGSASSKRSTPPKTPPTLPTSTQEETSSNQVVPSTLIFVPTGVARSCFAPVHR